MAEERVRRRLAAILVADVVGYSRLMGEDETGTLAQLKTLRKELLDPKIAEYGGRVVKTMGDGLLIEFPSVVEAVSCAVEVQRAIAEHEIKSPEDRRIEFRIGINLGDVIVEGDDIYGDGVNVAARLEAMCEPGSVYVSGSVFEQVTGKLEGAFDDLGGHTVKNLDKPIRVYRVSSKVRHLDPVSTATEVERLLDRPAVAVLPFENLSGDLDQEYFVDGLTEDIITALSLWRSFPVVARHSTFAYKETLLDIRQVGQELGARYVIEGSVRKGSKRVRVTAQLIDAKTGHHVWAERYDRDLADIFAVQDELTQRISAIVVPEVERVEGRRLKATTPHNLDAWDYVLRGMAGLNEFSEEGTLQAREMFTRATEIDPEYSRAYSGLARSFFGDLALGMSDSVEDVVAQGFAAAGKAVDLDDTDSLAHEMLGIALTFRAEFESAVTEVQRAIELNPSNARAYSNLGYLLATAGRPDDGIPLCEKGLALNPQDPRNAHYLAMQALAQLTARRYEDAVRSAEKAVQRRSDNPGPYLYLAASLGHLGRLPEAREVLDSCNRIRPGYPTRALRWIKFKHEANRDHLLEGLRKAGWEG